MWQEKRYKKNHLLAKMHSISLIIASIRNWQTHNPWIHGTTKTGYFLKHKFHCDIAPIKCGYVLALTMKELIQPIATKHQSYKHQTAFHTH